MTEIITYYVSIVLFKKWSTDPMDYYKLGTDNVILKLI